MQAFAFQPVCNKSGIFRFESRLVSAMIYHATWNQRDVTWNRSYCSDQIPHPLWVVIKCPAPGKTKFINWGAFHSTKNSGNSGMGSEWNSHFPEFHFEILGVPREVGLKFRKIGIPGKFRSIQPFLLRPSFSEPGNRQFNMADPQASKHNILVFYQTNDWNILLQRYCSGLAS